MRAAMTTLSALIGVCACTREPVGTQPAAPAFSEARDLASSLAPRPGMRIQLVDPTGRRDLIYTRWDANVESACRIRFAFPATGGQPASTFVFDRADPSIELSVTRQLGLMRLGPLNGGLAIFFHPAEGVMPAAEALNRLIRACPR